jgi:hypothetical protein
VLLLNRCLLLSFISLSTQSGNFLIHRRMNININTNEVRQSNVFGRCIIQMGNQLVRPKIWFSSTNAAERLDRILDSMFWRNRPAMNSLNDIKRSIMTILIFVLFPVSEPLEFPLKTLRYLSYLYWRLQHHHRSRFLPSNRHDPTVLRTLLSKMFS